MNTQVHSGRALRAPFGGPFSLDDIETILADALGYVRDIFGVTDPQSKMTRHVTHFVAVLEGPFARAQVCFTGNRQESQIRVWIPDELISSTNLGAYQWERDPTDGFRLGPKPHVPLAHTLRIIASGLGATGLEIQFVRRPAAQPTPGYQLELVEPGNPRLCRALVSAAPQTTPIARE